MKSLRLLMVSGAVAAAFALSACGTGGNPGPGSGDGGGASAGAKRDLSVSVVVHAQPDNAFWRVVKQGALDAGEQYGVDVHVVGDGEGAKQATLIEAELAKQPDGLVVSAANPDALRSALAAAGEADVPFVTINSGAEDSAALGAIGHLGQSEAVAGEGAGRRLAESGATKMLCIIHEAGNIGLEQRCDGAADAFGGEVENLQVDVANPQGIQASVKSKLLADPGFDAVLSLDPAVTTATLAGMDEAGSDAALASFDINSDVLDAIAEGRVLFTVDQQQYLQGYLGVAFLVLYHDNLNTVGGGMPVLTGPAYVTRENVDEIADLVRRGTR
ncbi:substrate-binding domain-containing protein [Leucobacter sp. CSA1]|uniref:Substrate-binding domain-containing protein n=1 Tax=Leucobacter chromiisoli TaxID=2796471 RepID=A0A934Q8S8_9MICO|nr:substrate-binding domain-containing protein [Leucobacter chromiisoli]MBK0419578.1 substrate-binding domain-containing protein [Leucobacter chromiisoli]